MSTLRVYTTSQVTCQGRRVLGSQQEVPAEAWIILFIREPSKPVGTRMTFCLREDRGRNGGNSGTICPVTVLLHIPYRLTIRKRPHEPSIRSRDCIRLKQVTNKPPVEQDVSLRGVVLKKTIVLYSTGVSVTQRTTTVLYPIDGQKKSSLGPRLSVFPYFSFLFFILRLLRRVFFTTL